MPLKWKIFKVISYLLLLFTLGLIIFFTYSFFGSWQEDAENEITIYIIFLVSTGVVTANFCNNIILTEKYYPAETMEENWKVYSGVVFFFSCLVMGFISIALILHAYDIINKKSIRSEHFVTDNI